MGSEFPSGQKPGQDSHWPGKAKISSEGFTLKLDLPFSQRWQYFRSCHMRRRRKSRDLQTHPNGPPPRPTHQPCPGEEQLHSDSSAPPNKTPQGPFGGGQHLFSQQQDLALLADKLQ